MPKPKRLTKTKTNKLLKDFRKEVEGLTDDEEAKSFLQEGLRMLLVKALDGHFVHSKTASPEDNPMTPDEVKEESLPAPRVQQNLAPVFDDKKMQQMEKDPQKKNFAQQMKEGIFVFQKGDAQKADAQRGN